MWWFYGLLAVIALVAYLYWLGTKNYGHFKERKFPYMTARVPFLGNFWPMVLGTNSMGDMLKDMYNQFDGLPLVGIFTFTSPVILVRDPEMIKLVTVKDFDHFADRVNPMTEDIEPLMGRNLLGLQGQQWKDMRSTLSPSFTGSKMKAMFGMVRECGLQMGHFIHDQCTKADGSFECEMKDLFTRYTNDVIATSAFGIRVDSLREPDNEFYVTGKDLVNFAGVRALVFLGYQVSKRLMKLLGLTIMSSASKDFFRSLITDTISEREKNSIVRPDMIHLLMEARREAAKPSENNARKLEIELDDETVTAQALIFFLAGFDTASSSLCFLTHLLAEHPNVQRKLQAEIDLAVDGKDGLVSYEAIGDMKYLDMCVNEALRLWPPGVATNRKCIKDYEFPATESTPSYRVRKGEGVWIPVFGLHRDPRFFPRPDEFRPERFAEGNKEHIRPFTFMPFGTGPRNCIGMRFALMEVKIAAVSLLARFDLSPSDKTRTPLKLARKSFNMAVEGGFWIRFNPRDGVSAIQASAIQASAIQA